MDWWFLKNLDKFRVGLLGVSIGLDIDTSVAIAGGSTWALWFALATCVCVVLLFVLEMVHDIRTGKFGKL